MFFIIDFTWSWNFRWKGRWLFMESALLSTVSFSGMFMFHHVFSPSCLMFHHSSGSSPWDPSTAPPLSCCYHEVSQAVAGKRACEPVWPRLDSASALQLFKKVVVCGHSLVTLSLTINETLKRLSFWWWQWYVSPSSPPPYPLLPVPNKPDVFCGR